MESGYVLNFSDPTFGEFFGSHKIQIHGDRYKKYGTSKAKKLRAFWDMEPDPLVGKILSELLDVYEVDCDLEGRARNQPVLENARAIAQRLNGKSTDATLPLKSEGDFLDQEFAIPNLHRLPVEAVVLPIIEARLEEARKCLKAGSSLAVIFLCGSILEAVLLGAAQNSPRQFNSAAGAPKNREGKVMPLHQWPLASFVDVAAEVRLLSPDVKKFSHGLRDFRNYIHPYEQMTSGFSPDQHTAKLCFQVLKAALANVAGERD
jgi:hypothetical protein